MVNRQRAKMLGVAIADNMGTEECVDECLALERHPDIR